MSLERYERGEGLLAEAYATEEQVMGIIRSLIAAGFDDSHISVLARDEEAAARVANATGTEVIGQADIEELSEGPTGILDGALMGVITVAIPGVGVFVAGPLAAIIGGADSPEPDQALADVLATSRVPDDEARRLEERLVAGDIVVAVYAGDRQEEARAILAPGAPSQQ